MQEKCRIVSMALMAFVFICSLSPAQAAIPKSKAPRYNVNMRIGLKGTMPFSVNTIAKAGKKTSFTEISSDGNTETLVEMVSRKSMQNDKAGLLINVKVTRTVKGNIKAVEKGQIFATENEETEVRVGATGRGRESLSLAVLATPI